MTMKNALLSLTAVCLLSLGSGCGVQEEAPELELGESRQDLTAKWSLTGSMATAREEHTATLLPSGSVLVTGGRGNWVTSIASAELYNPATGTWTSAGSMGSPRLGHTATLLPNGKVLVAGGYSGSNYLASAELYNPATNTWSPAASMATAHYSHTATLLANGTVLVVSGAYNGSAEVYNPAANAWSSAGSMSAARWGHFAVRLSNNKVLVGGGRTLTSTGHTYWASAEVYDPATNTWSSAGSMSAPRELAAAVWVPSLGKVLVTGGNSNTAVLAAAELYDPVTNSWSPSGSMATPRSSHTATVLNSGLVLVTAGYVGSGTRESAEVYEPVTLSWSSAGSMSTGRSAHTATLLVNGKVLIVGGFNGHAREATAELGEVGAPELGSQLGPNLAQGDTCSASNTFQPTCGASSARDVSFYWTAPASSSYVFTTAGSNYDTVLAIADATSGSSLGCNDDASGTVQSMVVVSLTAGQRVRVIVDGYSSRCGLFKLNIFKVDGSLNSSQGTAISTGTTCGAGHDSAPTCGSATASADLTYLWFPPTSGTFTFTTAGSNFDTVLELFNLGSNTTIGCNDDVNGTFQSSVPATLTAGQAVLVTVEGFGSTCGNYQLNVN